MGRRGDSGALTQREEHPARLTGPGGCRRPSGRQFAPRGLRLTEKEALAVAGCTPGQGGRRSLQAGAGVFQGAEAVSQQPRSSCSSMPPNCISRHRLAHHQPHDPGESGPGAAHLSWPGDGPQPCQLTASPPPRTSLPSGHQARPPEENHCGDQWSEPPDWLPEHKPGRPLHPGGQAQEGVGDRQTGQDSHRPLLPSGEPRERTTEGGLCLSVRPRARPLGKGRDTS